LKEEQLEFVEFYLNSIKNGEGHPILNLAGYYSDVRDYVDEHVGMIQDQMFDVILSENELSSLPNFLSKCRFIRSIDVRSNNLSEANFELFEFENLQGIELGGNPIESIKLSERILGSLTRLTIDQHELSVMLSELAQMTSLLDLTITRGMLEYLDDNIGHLPQLRSMDLHNNIIQELPDSTVDLKSVQEINLHSNQLTYLPGNLNGLFSLTKLDLSYNRIKSLPDSIVGIGTLKVLNLEVNQLKELPERIGSLRGLHVLEVNNNYLESLPSSVANLRVSVVQCQHNSFRIIPTELFKIKELELANFSDNPIETISGEVFGMKNLQLMIRNCPLDIGAILDSVQGIQKVNNVTLYLAGCPVEDQKDQLPKIPGLTFSFEPTN